MINQKDLIDQTQDGNDDPLLSARTKHIKKLLEERDADFKTEEWLQIHGKMIKRKVDANSRVRYRLVFDLLDEHNTGMIDFQELYEALRFTGLKMTVTELGFMVSKIGADLDHISFDDFVNGLASTSEWDSILDIRRKRQKEGKLNNVDPVMPFILWIPAFHRMKMYESVMSLRNIKNKSATGKTGLGGLNNQDRASKQDTLVGKWYEVLRGVRGDQSESDTEDYNFDYEEEMALVNERHKNLHDLVEGVVQINKVVNAIQP